jgi:polyisoprenyl-phosphate glycosyltransferase
MKLISVVTPCFNEEAGIAECVNTLKAIFETRLPDYRLEHIICDNCSTDRTVEILREIAKTNPSVKVIVNTRNFGILKNTYNGVMNASGDAVVLFMPADLQDPPELIVEFVSKWAAGYEIVYGIRAQREEGFFLRTVRRVYYRLLSRLTYVNYPPDVGDYQLVDRRVLDAMRRIDDAQPFMRLMTFECGFRSVGVPYTWRARKHGTSKNRFVHMLDQGLNGIISFSGAPVRILLPMGLLVAIASIVYSAGIVILTLIGYIEALPGVPTIIAALFFFGGVQLFFLGILGEYILAIFNQVRRKPMVIERERINFE